LDLADDGGSPSVDVIVAQAPLFSTSPTIGQKFKYLGIFHTTIVLAQTESNGESRYWTIEFDYTGDSILRSVVPDFSGEQMTWNKNARYCLSEGLLWGRGHWTKSFEIVARLTTVEAQHMLNAYVVPTLNSTSSGINPQYQLWRVTRPSLLPWRHAEVLIHDVTCADGANWILHYLAKLAHVPLASKFKFKGSGTVLSVDRVERVSPEDRETWSDMVAYFRTLADMVAANKTLAERLHDVLHYFSHKKYVYDTNMGVYFMLVGNRDRFHFSYDEYLMEGPFFQNVTDVADVLV
jgi:hypothetical protein